MRTITAMFDNYSDAETARDRLADAGISTAAVTIHDKSSLGDTSTGYARDNDGDYDDEADGREGTHRNAIGDYVDNRTGTRLMEDAGSDRTALGDYVEGDNGEHRHADGDHDRRGLWQKIKAFFADDDDVYEEGLRRGGYVLTAHIEDHQAERAIDILDTDGTVDLGAREASWRNEGWSGRATDVDRGARSRIGSYPTDTMYS
jgi:hypothetical protein